MSKHILSKSTFMYGCQCEKRLFLCKFRPELRNPEDERKQAILESGTNVGLLARDLFKGGEDASPPDFYSYDKSIAKTKKLIESGAKVIYEAAFQFNEVMCALEILVNKKDKWYAYEVKGSTSVKEQYVQDAALQYHVITNSGLELEDISIVYLNNEYTRIGELDIKQLFSIESVLEPVIERQDSITEKIEELKAMLSLGKEPQVDIGPHCSDPFGCDFTEHCWQGFPKENNIFSLAYGPGWKLYDEGFKHLDDIPEGYPLSKRPAMQLEYYRSGNTHIDKEAISEFLGDFHYPLYFFDFESVQPAVPEFDHSRPYQQIPFQFSLHIKRKPDFKLEHHSFLGDGVNDPREALIGEMITLLGHKGTIIGWSIAFEKTRISELAEDFPKYKKQLLAFNERMVDLIVPFRSRSYYHPDFEGSASIKNVLPVLVPELSYSALDIQEGGTASLVYSQLKFQDEGTRLVQCQQLLDYCCLDTLAMVRIWEKLGTLERPEVSRKNKWLNPDDGFGKMENGVVD